MFLTLTGATLPIVGGVFGAFVAALLSSKVINIAIGGANGLNVWRMSLLDFCLASVSAFREALSRLPRNAWEAEWTVILG
jgi:hypothetical protein